MRDSQPVSYSSNGKVLRLLLATLWTVLLSCTQFWQPATVHAQYGGMMGGYSLSPEGLGGSAPDSGWQAEITSKHQEAMDEQRRRDDDLKKTLADAGPRNEPAPPAEAVAAHAFIAQFDLTIPPELVEKVRKDPRKVLEQSVGFVESMRKSHEPVKARQALVTLGHVYYLLGLFKEASAKYSDALKLCRDAGDTDGEAQLLNNLGSTSAASGAYEDALASYQTALNKYRETRNLVGERRTRNNLAVLAQNRGQTDAAITQFQEALDPSAGTDELRIITLENLGRIYSQTGDHKQAVDCLTESIALIRKLGDTTREAASLMVLAEIYGASGAHDKSLECLMQARGLLAGTGEVPHRLDHLIGSALLDSGRIAEAEPYIKESGFRSGLARLNLMKLDFTQARSQYDELLKVANQYGRRQDLFTAYTGLGKVYESLGDLRKAEKYYSQASDASEQLRSSLLLSERKRFYSTSINGFQPIEPVRGLVRVRMKTNRAAESLVASEQIRARNFVDRMARRLPVSDSVAPKAIQEQEAILFDKVASLMKARDLFPRQQDPHRFDQLTRLVGQAEQELKTFMEKLRKAHPVYYALLSGKPLTLAESGIRDNEYVLVLDALGEGVGVKLIKGKRLIYSVYEPWQEGDLERDIRQLLEGMTPERLDYYPTKVAHRLQERLCSQALSKVPKGTPVIIIPDLLLGTVPFEALVLVKGDDGRETDDEASLDKRHFLEDLHPISYYQSVTALTLTRKAAKARSGPARFLVMADPVFSPDDDRLRAQVGARPADKPDRGTIRLMEITNQTGLSFPRLALTGRLAAALSDMFPGTTDALTGPDVTKAKLLSLPLDSYAYFVCATHGYFGTDIPGVMEPVLAMSLVPSGTDGFLTMSEVMGLSMNLELAALIACQTGLGTGLAGEGVMSMGRAFQYAGAKSVLISLWSIPEKTSVNLVESFFAHRKDGKSKSEALRLARSELRLRGYNHPFFWASFILVGEAD
jgi:CHAT domain-containing protein/Tfp pilus assembly protein PilF